MRLILPTRHYWKGLKTPKQTKKTRLICSVGGFKTAVAEVKQREQLLTSRQWRSHWPCTWLFPSCRSPARRWCWGVLGCVPAEAHPKLCSTPTQRDSRGRSPALATQLTSIFWASSDGLKLDLMTTLTSSLVRPTSLTKGMTRNGRMMSLVVRYLPQDKMMSPSISSTSQHSPNQLSLWKWPPWPHELVLSIRRDKADASLQVKLTEAHALVEGAVVDSDGLLPTAQRQTQTRVRTTS